MKALDAATVDLQSGVTLLEASAGTGKTDAIIVLLLRLLLEGKVDSLSQILVVTFTVAATEELKTRIRTALRDTLAACEGQPVADPRLQEFGRRHGQAGALRLQQALAAADEMSVATIHAFCKRVLEEAAFESGEVFAAEFVEDEIPLLLQAAQDAVREVVCTRDVVCAAVAAHASLLPDELVDDYRAWQRHLETRLRPAPGPLAPALAALGIAIQTARACHNTDPPPQLARLPFKESAPKALREPGSALVTELQARLRDADDPCLPLLFGLSRRQLLATCQKRQLGGWVDHPFFVACEQVEDAATTAAVALRGALLAAMRARLQRHQQRHAQLVFQDLLTRVALALRDPERRRTLLPAVHTRWRAALIDEFQDTDPLQYEIFATCFAERPLFLVGDPKQSIYAFRGADVHAYLEARADAACEGTLDQNHRSHPLLVAAVHRLFAGPLAFATSAIALPPVQAAIAAADRELLGESAPPLQFRFLGQYRDAGGRTDAWRKDPLERRIIGDVADECVRLLASGLRLRDGGQVRALGARDLAVLTRTNAQAVAVQAELRARGVHSAIARAGDVFRCPELLEMQRLLAALTNPLDLSLLRAAWTTLLWGKSVPDLRALEADAAALQRELEFADDLRRTWLRHGFVVMFERLLTALDARRRLLQRRDGERKLTNYLQVAELLHRAELDRQLAPESLLLWLRHERRHAEDLDYQLRELRLESDADAVKIMTIHGSKGLQFEIVFAPFLGSSYDGFRAHLLVRNADGGMDYVERGAVTADDKAAAARERIAEDVRLCYVALTRARRRCYVHWADTRGADGSALGFLLHGPGRADARDGELVADWHQAVGKRVEKWAQDLRALADGSDGAIGCALLPQEAPAVRAELPAGAAAAFARARPLPQSKPDAWRIASFTSILAGTRAGAPVDDGERDRAEPEPAAVAAAAASAAAPLRGIHAFARGTKAGICLHAILEQLDFADAGSDGSRALVEQQLRQHGLEASAAHLGVLEPAADVHAMLQQLCAATLPGLGFALADLPAPVRAPEWQFFLPAGRLQPAELANVFRATGASDYAERLQRLSHTSLHGFLRGFVDLVAEHGGRFFVFDWKSNWLGADAGAYGDAALRADLAWHDYVLQYHLYLLALHRHLRARLRDYDYDRHVGGACYVYLRGVEHEQRGAVVDRPPRARIDALDRWLEGRR